MNAPQVMHIVYCGDRHIEDGVLISVLSAERHASLPLDVTILTMNFDGAPEKGIRTCQPVRTEFVQSLNDLLAKSGGSARLVDASRAFAAHLPTANLATRFTPGCMLRLYLLDACPQAQTWDRVLYLDNDVVCRGDIAELYRIDLTGYEMAGALDYYGRFFFRNNLAHMDYLNSGVLLMNLNEMRKTQVLTRCQELCATKRMFMPDQSALNRLVARKLIVPRKFNDQRKLHEDTVLQHFTTSFRFVPWIHTVNVKPWQVDRMHEVLHLHEYDDVLADYQQKIQEFNYPGLREVNHA